MHVGTLVSDLTITDKKKKKPYFNVYLTNNRSSLRPQSYVPPLFFFTCYRPRSYGDRIVTRNHNTIVHAIYYLLRICYTFPLFI